MCCNTLQGKIVCYQCVTRHYRWSRATLLQHELVMMSSSDLRRARFRHTHRLVDPDCAQAYWIPSALRMRLASSGWFFSNHLELLKLEGFELHSNSYPASYLKR